MKIFLTDERHSHTKILNFMPYYVAWYMTAKKNNKKKIKFYIKFFKINLLWICLLDIVAAVH